MKIRHSTAAAAAAAVAACLSLTVACTVEPGDGPQPEPSIGTPTKSRAVQAELPRLVGKGLQSAQDAARKAGFTHLTSHDSLGRRRLQILDREWKVCSQSPPAGTHLTDTKVDLGAVKTRENCPSKDRKPPGKATDTMPDFTGKSVNAAREALDSATSIDAKDASGKDRIVLLGSNWKVCSQKPSAGTKLSGQPVTFEAVKFGEQCP